MCYGSEATRWVFEVSQTDHRNSQIHILIIGVSSGSPSRAHATKFPKSLDVHFNISCADSIRDNYTFHTACGSQQGIAHCCISCASRSKPHHDRTLSRSSRQTSLVDDWPQASLTCSLCRKNAYTIACMYGSLVTPHSSTCAFHMSKVCRDVSFNASRLCVCGSQDAPLLFAKDTW